MDSLVIYLLKMIDKKKLSRLMPSALRFAVIACCFLLLYASVIQKLVSDWIHMPDFSHGFLIPIVSLYFVYERRKELRVLNPSSNWVGLGLIIFGILLLLL